jgi:hypothetical protein
MKLREWIEGSGVYSIPASELTDEAWFIRDTRPSKPGQIASLLHICTRDIDPGFEEESYVITTGVVRWNQVQGYYMCLGCKDQFEDEEHLRGIWEDGLGTGDEAHA